MVTASPKVSVLMPVCNGMPFLTDAIDSILAQTFDDFEFVIIDDGSSDESREVLKRYASRDRRIKLLLNDTNTGIAQVLNAGIDVCRGEYIARMDCDDLSLPQRFARQVDLMDRAPEVGVCGTWFTTFGHACGTYDHPVHDSDIKIHHLLHNAAIGHPTAFLRRRVLQETGIKYPDVAAHDLWFWINLGFATKLRNLPAPLLSYRIHQNQFSRVSNSQQYASATEARLFFAGRIFGRELTEPEKTAHRALSGGTVIADMREFEYVCEYAADLEAANAAAGLIEQPRLHTAVGTSLRRLPVRYAEARYKYSRKFDFALLRASLHDPLRPLSSLGLNDAAQFVVKCVIGHIPRTSAA